MPTGPKDPTAVPARINSEAVARYDLADRQDFADADRGLIARFPGPVLGAVGHIIFDPSWLEYVADDAPTPDSVNPSLWRQSQVIKRGGLYQVTWTRPWDGGATTPRCTTARTTT